MAILLIYFRWGELCVVCFRFSNFPISNLAMCWIWINKCKPWTIKLATCRSLWALRWSQRSRVAGDCRRSHDYEACRHSYVKLDSYILDRLALGWDPDSDRCIIQGYSELPKTHTQRMTIRVYHADNRGYSGARWMARQTRPDKRSLWIHLSTRRFVRHLFEGLPSLSSRCCCVAEQPLSRLRNRWGLLKIFFLSLSDFKTKNNYFKSN